MHLGRTTLSKFLIQQLEGIEGSRDLGALLIDVAAAVKTISSMAAKGALGGFLGKAGTENVQGEQQVKLDVASNDVILKSCDWGGLVAGMASEELDDPYPIPAEYPRGRFLLVFDPLDGSSNADVNVSVGTIFSILRHDRKEAPKVEDFLQKGIEQVAAGYAIYGPSTMLVITVGKGTHGFTLDREVGNFILTHPNLRIPEDTSEFAINTSNARFWEIPVHRYVTECQDGQVGRAWPRFQHALDRFDGGRGASHPGARRRVHVSARHPRSGKARAPATDVRGQPDQLPGGAGGRRVIDWSSAAHGTVAAPAAPARAGDPGLEERSRAHRALPLGARQRHRPPLFVAAVQRAVAVPAERELTTRGRVDDNDILRTNNFPASTHMSTKHPVIAVTGSSGAGTSTVMKSFAHIFRRDGFKAQVIEGDSFHRYDRVQMRAKVKAADTGEGPQISHFGPESNLLADLATAFETYGTTGGGKVRRYVHDELEAKELGSAPGTFTEWQPIAEGSDLLFYEGLHGGYVGPEADVAKHVDLLVGVVPIINLEWIQKLHRDKTQRGYSQDAVVDTILRRMPDYVNHICPQFSRTHVNFQRVPTVDTSNPFIAKDIPSADESMVIIRFANPKGIDFPYLLSMLDESWMSRPNNIVVPGGKMGLAMQLILTPLILRLMDRKRRA